ncbi:aromatic amino acid aminotransferase I / 2-aminoadipate transaminase [Geosmithia morbida]|uniref:Aromatic amino acid aminotransferase I / 2-aminoadipate transaminase n=1 Tax=Geosmithia morbida TaxID=1094350 RepID=A0A9P4YP08_9HYPO|nr:aromatic amino acid aminotransferase I / 2-aminoadipate transaminase [Geosmithia morbida]KAF4119410.1 aromatic amino acid aminotransferase I / 2-aminoadipate transaminase [Geosmithia morbida]
MDTGTSTLSDAVDLAHHVNTKSRSRHPSPLKDIVSYMGYEGMISLAGGLPHPSLFPLNKTTFECLDPSADKADGVILRLGRGSDPADLDLTQFLQYGSGAGNKGLIALCRELTTVVHTPPYNFECLLHPGNTNAWDKVVGLLCEDDDYVLVEEYTYPSAQALWIPLGIKAAPIAADGEGIQPSSLREILQNWDEKIRGARRPRTLYIVPVGSNPTGTSISFDRRKEIYSICVEYGKTILSDHWSHTHNEAVDIIIVEDDPYYFLQYPGYKQTGSKSKISTKDFLSDLSPSFLSMDTQGRVIRLESFSKTLFPGLRLGYFVANPIFTERLLRATETETQDPAGLSQAFVLSLLSSWGIDGYLLWLQHLQEQYRLRRDWLLDAFHQHFVVNHTGPEETACVSHPEMNSHIPVFSYVDPGAGMFVWAKFHFRGVKRFAEIASDGNDPDPEQSFADEMWRAMIDELVLLTPGSYYHPWQGADNKTTKARGAEAQTAHFRFSFATPTSTSTDLGS